MSGFRLDCAGVHSLGLKRGFWTSERKTSNDEVSISLENASLESRASVIVGNAMVSFRHPSNAPSSDSEFETSESAEEPEVNCILRDLF